jgi:hypothetical protein
MDLHTAFGHGSERGHAVGERREDPHGHLADGEGDGESKKGEDEARQPDAPPHARDQPLAVAERRAKVGP